MSNDKIEEKISKIFKKNCFTCKYIDTDSTDYEYGNSNYYVCTKDDDKSDFRFDQMYDKDGKETNYLKKSKKCHEFSNEIYFNHLSIDLREVLK